VIWEVVDIVTDLIGLKMEYVHWICPLSFTIEREGEKLAVVWWARVIIIIIITNIPKPQFIHCASSSVGLCPVTVHYDCVRHLLCETWIGYVFKLNHFIIFEYC